MRAIRFFLAAGLLLALPGGALAASPSGVAVHDLAPTALRLPSTAFPAGFTIDASSEMPNVAADAATDPFRTLHTATYTSLGRLDGYYQSGHWAGTPAWVLHYAAHIFHSADEATHAEADAIGSRKGVACPQGTGCLSLTIGDETYRAFTSGAILVEILALGTGQPGSGAGAAVESVAAAAETAVETAAGLPLPGTTGPSLTVRAIDAGRQTPVLYRHDPISISVHYGGAGHGSTLQVSMGRFVRTIALHGATGALDVPVSTTLAPGRTVITASLGGPKGQVQAHSTVTVFDPAGFYLSPHALPASATVHVARVESTAQADTEPFVLHMLHGGFYKPTGRQAGYFERMVLRWPGVDASQAVVQADMVSIYRSPVSARQAFAVEAATLHYFATHDPPDAAVAPVAAPSVGDCCRAAYLVVDRARVQVRETVFVRGQVLIQTWSYLSGSTGHIAAPTDRAIQAVCRQLDGIAWSQQR